MIKVTAYNTGSGGLWFEIPNELQASVAKWLRSKINKCSDVYLKQRMRDAVTSATRSTKYSERIQFEGGWCVYACFGEWRVGDSGISVALLQDTKNDILADLRAFAAK